jgi:hypothetical protein
MQTSFFNKENQLDVNKHPLKVGSSAPIQPILIDIEHASELLNHFKSSVSKRIMKRKLLFSKSGISYILSDIERIGSMIL